MRRLAGRWTPHTVVVQPFLGEGGNGRAYGPPVTLSPDGGTGVYVEEVQEVIRDGIDGQEVVSSGRVHMSFEDVPPVESLITVWPGRPFERESVAIKVARFEHPRWPGYGVVYLR